MKSEGENKSLSVSNTEQQRKLKWPELEDARLMQVCFSGSNGLIEKESHELITS